MNRDRVKGTIDEVIGTAKRKAGKRTGDTPLQVKGITQQVKGRLEKTLGKAKDVVHKASNDCDSHAEDGLEYSTAEAKRTKSD